MVNLTFSVVSRPACNSGWKRAGEVRVNHRSKWAGLDPKPQPGIRLGTFLLKHVLEATIKAKHALCTCTQGKHTDCVCTLNRCKCASHTHYTYTHPSKTDGIHMHWAHSLYIQLLVTPTITHTYTIPPCTVLCTHYMCTSHTLHIHCYMSSHINTSHMYYTHKPLHTHTATHKPHTSSVMHVYTTCSWQIHTAYILYMHTHCYTYITL